MPRDVVIVEALRSPLGRRNGALSGWHPVELTAQVLRGLAESTGLDPVLIDDVIVGCVTQVGAQSNNIARSAVLAAGWPESVPGCTVDRQCGSSQQAIHFAAQSIAAGANDIVVAAGVESMSQVPMFSNITGEVSDPYGEDVRSRYIDRDSYGNKGLIQQGIAAERLVDAWKLTRERLDEFALASHAKSASARDGGLFDREIAPLPRKTRGGQDDETVNVVADEGIRDTSLEKLAALPPVFLQPDGRITAGNASQISDGAAALLLMGADTAAAHGLQPLARLVNYSVRGGDPIAMLDVPIAATRDVLRRAKLSINDVDEFEINEAFAPVVLAWQDALAVDPDTVNLCGGAISLGHPLGASGARLMVTLVHQLRRTGGRFGLQSICEAGGMANATLIEALR
jgi:acetyl-CoA acetyltransferase family protein